MRCDTTMSLDEVEKVCLHFNISFDSIINYSGKLVPFQFNAMFGSKFSMVSYLENIKEELKALAKIEDAKIVMTCMDLPYFRQFGFSSLSRFKLFFWQRSVLNLESYRHKKFDANEPIDEFESVTEQIYKNYLGVPSTEIWAPETLDSTIKQIMYFIESGLFVSKDTAHQICDDIDALLIKLEREAERGEKMILSHDSSISSSFKMYQSDIYMSNNCIQAFLGEKVFTYVSFNSFNSLMSFTPSFSNECNLWIEQIRSKSILLSEVSEKLRYQFFKRLRSKMSELRNTINQ